MATYALRQHIWTRMLNLPKAAYDVRVTQNERVAMVDGITLATDIYHPQTEEPQPTILIRTPYGRNGTFAFLEIFFAYRFAERGYNVVLQDVRGRYESEGEFIPYASEACDGETTVNWIVEQAWSDGQVALWGQSYLGYTQWAVASTQSPHVKAMMPITTQSHLGGQPEHGRLLDLPLRWLYLLDAFDNRALSTYQRARRLMSSKIAEAALAEAFETLPMSEADQAVLGSPVPFFREWVDNPDQDHPYWQPFDFRPIVPQVAIPTHHIGGWYDIFLDGTIDDYEAQAAAGLDPYLTIGPWTHTDQSSRVEGLRFGLNLFDTYLKGKSGLLREKKVRINVMGVDEWREYDVWPPEAETEPLYLRADGGLSDDAPAFDEAPATYTYDPNDPTPNVGGALLSKDAGPRDNQALEDRDDVLTFTTPTLEEAVEMIGKPSVTLYVQSSADWTDFFGRITDVYPDGSSINVTDGIYSLTPERGERWEDGTIKITVNLSATAYRFQAGHQIRLQVSSGAHPRFGRNLGTGEPLNAAKEMLVAEQTLYHDAAHASHMMLPIVEIVPADMGEALNSDLSLHRRDASPNWRGR